MLRGLSQSLSLLQGAAWGGRVYEERWESRQHGNIEALLLYNGKVVGVKTNSPSNYIVCVCQSNYHVAYFSFD